MSGVTRSMELDVEQWQIDHWKHGELIQNAFPLLNVDEREFIKTGITPNEWELMYESD
jgi:hypothetical protein